MKKIFILFLLLLLIPLLSNCSRTDFITVNEQSQPGVQRDIGGTSADITISGTYEGKPTSIKAEILNWTTGAVLSGWKTIVASPAGGKYSGTYTACPQGGWYKIKVAYKNNDSISDLTPKKRTHS